MGREENSGAEEAALHEDVEEDGEDAIVKS